LAVFARPRAVASRFSGAYRSFSGINGLGPSGISGESIQFSGDSIVRAFRTIRAFRGLKFFVPNLTINTILEFTLPTFSRHPRGEQIRRPNQSKLPEKKKYNNMNCCKAEADGSQPETEPRYLRKLNRLSDVDFAAIGTDLAGV
jgi:hypothetical protein